jgi:hypothetical protein
MRLMLWIIPPVNHQPNQLPARLKAGGHIVLGLVRPTKRQQHQRRRIALTRLLKQPLFVEVKQFDKVVLEIQSRAWHLPLVAIGGSPIRVLVAQNHDAGDIKTRLNPDAGVVGVGVLGQVATRLVLRLQMRQKGLRRTTFLPHLDQFIRVEASRFATRRQPSQLVIQKHGTPSPVDAFVEFGQH